MLQIFGCNTIEAVHLFLLIKIEKSNHIARTNLDEYIKTHKIDVDDLRDDNFEEFFIKRARSLLGLISEAMSKSISNLDGEDIIAGFGGPLDLMKNIY
jgi:hypothetical protein